MGEGKEETSDPSSTNISSLTIRELLELLDVEVRSATEFDITTEGTFMTVLKGCFLRAHEFALLAHDTHKPGTAFFLAPALRGICEDLIALKYLGERHSVAERDELVLSMVRHRLGESIDKQVAFFEKTRPYQPVFRLKEGVAFAKPKLPNVKAMAEAVRLTHIYDFIYSIASDVVHFNPRIVMRNSWGDHPIYSNSSANFDSYYLDFSRIYSVYLYGLLADNFRSLLELQSGATSIFGSLLSKIADAARWPEAVTFEEMNVSSPGTFVRMLLKIAHQNRSDSEPAPTRQ